MSGMKSVRKETLWIEKPSLDGKKCYSGSEQLGMRVGAGLGVEGEVAVRDAT